MNVSKVKRNSMAMPRKVRLNDYATKHDRNMVKNNLSRIQIPQTDQFHDNNNENIYLKSEFNIQKNNQSGSLTYIKSLPSHIVKKQFYITPSKIDSNKNIN